MNIVAIVAEYNPLHNGHVYQIAEAKKRCDADYVVIIMSGSFTEQGNIAIFNKFDRAASAIKNGADLVIELPTIYSTSSSEKFANGAVNILDSLGIITHISFGSECLNIATLESIVTKILSNEDYLIKSTTKFMKDGISAAVARDKSIKSILNKTEYVEFSKPNNILAIEYLKTISSIKSKIKPVLVERKDSFHQDTNICKSIAFASSTSIRNEIQNNIDYITTVKQFIPKASFNLLSSTTYKLNENIWYVLKYAIIKLGKEGLKDIKEVSEGLENRLYTVALKAISYYDYIFKVKSKRYTLGRIKRICVNIILGITKEMDSNLSNVKYARILKVKNESRTLLSLIKKHSSIPVISTLNQNKIKELDSNIINSLNLDILSTNISEIQSNNLNIDYTNYIF